MGRNSSGAQGVSVGTVVLLLVAVWLLGRCSGESSKSERDAAPISTVQPTSLAHVPAPLPEPVEVRYVDADSLNYRASPNGAVLGRLSRGTQVSVDDREGSWVKVSAGTSRTGWIAERYTCATTNCWHRVAATPVRPARVVPQRFGSSCPCSGSTNCIGPRGGRYCITRSGNKRYR
ncbi:SH3 domain-containing protein [Luteimonas marina]|uniref:SH3 domain-containing protein n=1 Tax=Luteimonas marina TaxID=488485 RepID=A0A5C5TXL7_9GAMM|nr:SH3 domain-containing protein [Luteimonas marina]